MYVKMIACRQDDPAEFFERYAKEGTEGVYVFRIEDGELYLDSDTEECENGALRVESYGDGEGWLLHKSQLELIKGKSEFYDIIGHLRGSRCGDIYFYYEEGTKENDVFKNAFEYIWETIQPDFLYEMTYSVFKHFMQSRLIQNMEGSYMIRFVRENYKIGRISANGILTKDYDADHNYYFKDTEAFLYRPDDVCYVPEHQDYGYTRHDLVELLGGNEKAAEELFDSLNWCMPETKLKMQNILHELRN